MRRAAAKGLSFLLPVTFAFLASAQQVGDAAAPKPTILSDAGPVASSTGGGSLLSDAGPPPARVVPKAPAGMDGSTYAVRLRDLEQRVEELKRQIRASQSRLSMLSESIVGDAVAGSRTEIIIRNEMSSAFKLVSVRFRFDNAVVYDRTDEGGSLSDQKEIPVYTGSLSPADHNVHLELNFKGNGFGVFSYLRSYNFEVRSKHTFTAIEGKVITITATAYELGGVTVPLEQRPTIRWGEKLSPLTVAPRGDNKGNPSGPKAPPPAGSAPAGGTK